jgi:hypothetical protein
MSCLSVHLWLFVDPVELALLVGDDLIFPEPQSDLLLGTLDTIRAVADVASNINGIVTTNGAGVRGERVGSSKDHL